jgi:hypothetical protein
MSADARARLDSPARQLSRIASAMRLRSSSSSCRRKPRTKRRPFDRPMRIDSRRSSSRVNGMASRPQRCPPRVVRQKIRAATRVSISTVTTFLRRPCRGSRFQGYRRRARQVRLASSSGRLDRRDARSNCATKGSQKQFVRSWEAPVCRIATGNLADGAPVPNATSLPR